MSGVKTFGLLAALSLLLVGVGAVLDQQYGGGGFFIYLFFGISMITNIGSYWFSDKIVLKMHKAQEVLPGEGPQLYEMVEALAREAQLPMPKVYVVHSDTPNAFATGRNPKHGAVAVTSGIIQTLSRDELEGVVAHELAHIKHYDTLLQTVVACIVGAIGLVAFQMRWAMLLFGGRRDGEGGGGILGLLLGAIVAPIAAGLLRGMISQQREFAADKGGAEICRNPTALASALQRIEQAVRGAGRVDFGQPTTEHLYFVNHFKMANIGGIGKLFSTHPPTDERIRRLLDMAERP